MDHKHFKMQIENLVSVPECYVQMLFLFLGEALLDTVYKSTKILNIGRKISYLKIRPGAIVCYA